MTTNTTTSRPGWGRRGWLALIALLLLALGLRLWYLTIHPLDPRFSSADDGDYYRRALRLALTGVYADDTWLIRPPFHVWFFAGLLRVGTLFGGLATGVKLVQVVQVVLGVIQVGLAADIARRLWRSTAAGLVLAAALAVWWPLIELPSMLLSELLYLFLWTLHLWLLARFADGRRLRWLALAGLVLGCAALTRSPALYALVFVAPWLLWLAGEAGQTWRARLGRALRWMALLAALTLAVVLPWTVRNYMLYDQIILVDTLGPINVWLDLGAGSERDAKIQQLLKLTQAERQDYASARASEIMATDPDPLLRNTLLRNAWPNFRHIWKAYFIEDYVVKPSFYGRPLRDVMWLGLLGDVIWLLIVVGGALALWRRRIAWGWFLLLLAWGSYTAVTVLVFHVEPRYLLPLWLALAWAAAGMWGQPRATLRDLRDKPLFGAGAALTLLAALALIGSYRDYGSMLSALWQREGVWRAADAQAAQGQLEAARTGYAQALAHTPNSEELRMAQIHTLVAEGRLDEAVEIASGLTTRRGKSVLGALLIRNGAVDDGVNLLTQLETTSGEDIYRWLTEALPQERRTAITLGSGTDVGAVAGFNGAEQLAGHSFRWTNEEATIVLALPQPLERGASLALTMAAPGRDGAGAPLELEVNGVELDLQVAEGWRRYILTLPPELAGTTELTIELETTPLIPVLRDPASPDLRSLGVMVSGVEVVGR